MCVMVGFTGKAESKAVELWHSPCLNGGEQAGQLQARHTQLQVLWGWARVRAGGEGSECVGVGVGGGEASRLQVEHGLMHQPEGFVTPLSGYKVGEPFE